LETKPPAYTSGDWPHFIIQSMADGVITVDGKLRITDLNRAGEKLLGYSREEALGRFCGDILKSSLCGRECPMKLAMNHGEAVSREAVLQNRLGQKIEIMLSASALRDDQGNLWGGVETFRDIGPFKLIEKERRYLVGMFAHDLKTPVVAVAGLLNRLRQGKVGDLTDQQIPYVETIFQEMQRLEKLITNFLDFARLDLHIIAPTPEAIHVEKECREVVNRFQALAEAKKIDLQMEFPKEVIILQADPLLFQRALGNLLDNALKYSPPQGNVVLAVHDNGAEVQFSLQDQGPGIAPQDLPHLFDLLYRGKSAAQEESGLGLGLAIVKRIIDAHGGRLWVDSQEGRGATFFFTIPRLKGDLTHH
jgi:two-component system, OmpR family, phosphate regulon sensor histidine kinase PhoR